MSPGQLHPVRHEISGNKPQDGYCLDFSPYANVYVNVNACGIALLIPISSNDHPFENTYVLRRPYDAEPKKGTPDRQ